MDLREATTTFVGDKRRLLTSLIKNRRRELLKDFAITDNRNTYKESMILTNYMYLLTEKEVYNQRNDLYILDGRVWSHQSAMYKGR